MQDAKFKPLPSKRGVVDSAISLLLLHGNDLVPATVKEYAPYAVDIMLPKQLLPSKELDNPFTHVLAVPVPETESLRQAIILVRYSVFSALMPPTVREVLHAQGDKASLAFLGSVYPTQVVPVPALFVLPDLAKIREQPIATISWGAITPTTAKSVANILVSHITEMKD